MENRFPDFQFNMDLSLEQKFRMQTFENSIRAMNPEEARSLLIEASKLLMVKDNIIKGLMKKNSSF